MSVFLKIYVNFVPKIHRPPPLSQSFAMLLLPYPSVRVQHVHGGVPLVLQHLVEGEYVLVVPVMAEVRVLDTTVGNTLLGGFKLFRGQNLINQSINQRTNHSINQKINQFKF